MVEFKYFEIVKILILTGETLKKINLGNFTYLDKFFSISLSLSTTIFI